MESLSKLGEELTSVLEERKETLRADGKSERPFVKTVYPEAYIEHNDGIITCFTAVDEETRRVVRINDLVKRFDRKRWELFWRKVVLERYTDTALAPVKDVDIRELTRYDFVNRQRIIHDHLIDRLFRDNKNILNNFWDPKPSDFPIERMMERRRFYELMFWESISFSAYYPKFANLDQDKRNLYNAENFFSERKRLTRSKLPLSLRSFGLFIQRLHTTPYAEEYRLPRRIREVTYCGVERYIWTAEPLRNEKGEARMHPLQGHKQNFMVDLSKKIWTRFNEETPEVVKKSTIDEPIRFGCWGKFIDGKWRHSNPRF